MSNTLRAFTIGLITVTAYLNAQNQGDIGKSKITQKEGTHQFIVREAYKLLTSQLDGNIPVMHDHVGTTEIGSGPFLPGGKLVIGAHREDNDDVVYPSHQAPWQVSSTHFWNADKGDMTKLKLATGEVFENAYQKARKYLYGGYELIVWSETHEGRADVYEAPSSLAEFYQTGSIYKYEVAQLVSGIMVTVQYVNQWVTVDLYKRNRIVWEILGRVAHLLADVGTPAHTHEDTHICSDLISDCDEYEEWMGSGTRYAPYNVDAAIQQRLGPDDSGGLIDVTNVGNPLKHLFYTTAQIANHFPSTDVGGNNGNGVNDVFSGYPPLESIIQYLGNPPANVNAEDIASVAFVYSIRATAGLLHWFAKEAGLLDFTFQVRNVTDQGLTTFDDFFFRDNTSDPFPVIGLPSGQEFTKNPGDLMSLRSHYELHSTNTKFFSWSSNKHKAAALHQNDYRVKVNQSHFDATYKMSETNLLPSLGLRFENGVIPPTQNATLLFKNPWFVNPDPNLTTQFNVDQHDWFFPLDVSYQGQPTQYHNGGVFLNAGRADDLQPPYYTLRASQVLDRQNMTHKATPLQAGDWVFMKYNANQAQLVNDPQNDGTGTYSDPEQFDTKAVIFEQANADVTAEYKAHRAALTSVTPTSVNSQRKVSFDENGNHYMVYESGGRIWCVKSTNRGSTWQNDFLVCDGSGGAKNPSISALEGVLYVTYVQNNEIVVRVWTSIGWVDRYRAFLQLPGNQYPVIAAAPSYDGAAGDPHHVIVVLWEDDYAGQHVLKFAALEGTNILVDNDVFVSGHAQGSIQHLPQYPSLATDPLPPTPTAPTNTFHVAWLENGSVFYAQISFSRSTSPPAIFGWSQGSGGNLSGVHSIETVHGLSQIWPALYAPSIGVSPSDNRGLSDKIIVAFDVFTFFSQSKAFIVRERVDHWMYGPSWSTTATLVTSQIAPPQYTAPSVGVLPPQKTGQQTKTDAVRVCFNQTNAISAVLRFDGTNLNVAYLADHSEPNVTQWSPNVGDLLAAVSGLGVAPFDYYLHSSNSNLNKSKLMVVRNSRKIVLKVDSGFAMLGVTQPRIEAEGNVSSILWDAAEDSLIIGVNTTISDKMRTESFVVPANATLVFDRELFGQNTESFSPQSSFVVHIRDASPHGTMLSQSIDISSLPTQLTTGAASLNLSGINGANVYLSFDVNESLSNAEAHIIDGYLIDEEVEKAVRNELPVMREAVLYPNHPNPFNPQTDITFFVPDESDIELSVVNLLGQRIAMIASGFVSPGRHSYHFDGTTLPSGIYIARLKVSGSVLSQKMTLLK